MLGDYKDDERDGGTGDVELAVASKKQPCSRCPAQAVLGQATMWNCSKKRSSSDSTSSCNSSLTLARYSSTGVAVFSDLVHKQS